MKSKKDVKPSNLNLKSPNLSEAVILAQQDLVDTIALQRRCKKIANARLIQPTKDLLYHQVCLITTVQKQGEVEALLYFYAAQLVKQAESYRQQALGLRYDQTVDMLYIMETYLEKLQILIKVRTSSIEEIPDPLNKGKL